MNPKITDHAFRILFILTFALGMVGIPGKSVEAEQSAFGQRMSDPMPRMDIDLRANQVYASGWIVGSYVTVSFDIPGSDTEWDYEKTVTVPEGWEAWCQFTISIDPTEFRIAAGQVARISDGTTTRQATLPDLRVTSEDPAADTISGIAPAGSTVNLQSTGLPGGGFRRHPVADGSGHWFADFAHPGTGSDEQGTFEIMPGTGAFWVLQAINDFVGIRFFWDYGPAVHVFPEEERIETYVWPAGSNLTLNIDDPATSATPDLTRTQMAQDTQGSGEGAIFEDLGPILPGSTISITDGLVTKTLTVTDLTLSGVDPKMDTVTGTAEPGSTVNVHICGDNGCSDRQVSAGSDRSWQADFSVRGQGKDGQDVLDLQPGNDIEVQLVDNDGDSTVIRRSVPNPRIEVLLTENWIHGSGWIAGTSVTLTIDAASNGAGVDYTATQPVIPDTPEGSVGSVSFEGLSLTMAPGDTVTLSAGNMVKTHIITNIAITSIDIEANAISGVAEPGSRIGAWIDTPTCCVSWEIDSDPSTGSWLADFSVPGDSDRGKVTYDIQAGSGGQAAEKDNDGDSTNIRWSVPIPIIPILQVSANQDYIEGVQWMLGNTITLEIDNPDTQLNPDYTDSKIVELNPGNPDQTYTVFKLSGIYDIQPGYLYSLSDGTITKTHIATSIAISNLDLELDTVSGNAEPGSRVEVWGCDQSACTFRFVNANDAGIWMADFAHPGSDEREQNTFDLAIGTWVNSVQEDDDGDTTMFVLDITDPGMTAEPTSIVPTSTPTLPPTISVPTPTLWKPIIVIVLIIVPLILIGLGIWYMGKRRGKGKE